jgi:Tol biopolymer transport system component
MKRILLAGVCVGIVALVVLASHQQRDAQQSTAVRIAPLTAVGAIHPRISPDGSTIAFSYQGAIWTTPRAGGTMTRLTDGTGLDIEPAWSPDGKRIAFVRSPNMNGGDLHVIEAADGKEIPLPKPVVARGPYNFQKLYFHSDGKRLLGPFIQDGKNLGLAWYDLDTGTVQSIAALGSMNRYALSPDGKWVVTTQSMDVAGQQGGNDGPQADVLKLPAGGGAPEKIARFPSRIHDLCWQTDGQALVVASDLGGAYYDLWQVPFDDPLRGMRKLTFGQADEDRPSLSQDGRWLTYTDNRAGATAIVVRDQKNSEEHAIPISEQDYRHPTGSLNLHLQDDATNKPITARISLQAVGGKFYAPPGAIYRFLRSYGHFYGDGQAKLHVPVGKYRLRVFRGSEYEVVDREIDIAAGVEQAANITLKRWTHQAQAGWFSGENHIHANYGYGQWYNSPRTMLQQCAGEDLNVCNFMVANSDTDGIFDRAYFRGGPDPLSTPETILYWNQEFRSTLWGHMTLVNLKQVVEPIMTGFKDTTNPWDIPTNSDIADRTHWQKGVVNYTHVAQNPDDPFQNPYAAKGIPVDVALGKIDTLDINNSYAGSVPIWHRLLNCGFRLPATAGTDVFLNRIASNLPGGDRVYVKIDGPLTYEKWIDGMKAGRSFVTNGPMLELSLGTHGLGDTIKSTEPRKLTVRAKAAAAFPLAKVELLYNGKVVANSKLAADEKSGALDQEILLDKSGWLALRATGPGHPDSPLPILYAHTNPIYVEIAGQPQRAKADALFFLNWIDQLAVLMRTRERIPTDELLRHVQQQLDQARSVYGRLAKE